MNMVQKMKIYSLLLVVSLAINTEAEEGYKVFVGGLSHSTDNEMLRADFAKFGEILKAFVITDRMTGRGRGFGFVIFKTSEEADAAVNGMNDKELDGHKLKVERVDSETSKNANTEAEEGYKVFVGSFSHSTDNKMLRAAFAKFGEILKAFVITDRFTGRGRGFGYVLFKTSEEADAAVNGMNDKESDGHKLKVERVDSETRKNEK